MTGFEPQTSGFGSYRSTNWATTTSLISVFCGTDHFHNKNNISKRIFTVFKNGVQCDKTMESKVSQKLATAVLIKLRWFPKMDIWATFIWKFVTKTT